MAVSMRRGVWTLDFRDQHGVRRWIQTKWTSEKDKKKAEKLLAHYEVQIDDGRFEAKSEQRDFEQLIKDYLAQLKVRAATRTDYESIINTHLRVYFNKIKLRAITRLEVEKFCTWMQTRTNRKPPSVRTVNKTLTMLSTLLKYAEGHGWINSNPCKHVRKLSQPIDARRRALDGNILVVDECNRLIAAAGSPRDRVLFHMAIMTGMRQGELFGLRWADIDWVGGRVHIRQSARKRKHSDVKTASSLRTIEISPTLLRELKEWKLACPKPDPDGPKERGQDLVFPNGAGHFECPHNFLREQFYPALVQAGLRKIRFHDLRHTCASLLIHRGEGIMGISRQLGHSSPNVTWQIYGHLLPGAGSPGARVFEGILSGSSEVAKEANRCLESGIQASTHGADRVLSPFPTVRDVVAEFPLRVGGVPR